jgi:hypothetical protein
LKGRTEREIEFAGQELRKNRQLSADARYKLNAKTLGSFLATTEADEALQLQRAQARELASITNFSDDAANSDAEIVPQMPLSARCPVTEVQLDSEQTEAIYGDL